MKGNARYIDELIFLHCGIKPMGLVRYFFTSAKKYNGYVAKKFSGLAGKDQTRLLRIVQREKKHRVKAWKRKS